MPAERCRVGVVLNGADQFFQRDMERKGRDGRWECVPYFVLNRSESVTMNEATARALVNKLRSLGATAAWVEDAADGRRIDVPHESQPQSGDDLRQPVIATLDDITWYLVRPTCTPNGRQWFISMFVPGLPERTTIYANDPLAALQRATDMNYLQFVEKYQRPEPQQSAPPIFIGPRRRPGDIS
jgi:hypothetical protein